MNQGLPASPVGIVDLHAGLVEILHQALAAAGASL